MKLGITKVLKKELKWQDPLNFAQKIADNYGDESWAFLYSGLSVDVGNSTSYIALFPKEEIIAEDFQDLAVLNKSEKTWFGYLSYELGAGIANLQEAKESYINLPKTWLINFSLIFSFCHDSKKLSVVFDDHNHLEEVLQYCAKESTNQKIKAKNLESNFSDQAYLNEICDIKKKIANGDFYQTNLTRKFFGKLEIEERNSASYFSIFADLCKISPANYSSFLSFKKNYIISSSPELFLSIDKEGENRIVKSLPIKGTSPRSDDPEQDKKNKLDLQNSPKERAENLMIVDLVRNDLSRVCKAGSVEAKKLFEIISYKTIHHMMSQIEGEIDDNCSVMDVIQACFPAGSMTGAPKIKAMQVAAQKEKMQRGIYSGTIGMISPEKVNLSVVIRTLICVDDDFEFQMGGAITFDSDEEMELKEIFNKARGIMKLLGLVQKNYEVQ